MGKLATAIDAVAVFCLKNCDLLISVYLLRSDMLPLKLSSVLSFGNCFLSFHNLVTDSPNLISHLPSLKHSIAPRSLLYLILFLLTVENLPPDTIRHAPSIK